MSVRSGEKGIKTRHFMKKQNTITIIASVLLMAGCSHREQQASYDQSTTSAPAYGSSDTSSSSATSAGSSSSGAAVSASNEGKNPSDARTITSGTSQDQQSLIYSNSTSQAEGAATSPSGVTIESVKGQGNDAEQKQEVQGDTSPNQPLNSTADQSTTAPSGDGFSANVQGSTSADQPVAQRIIEKIRVEPSLAGVMPLVRISVADGKATLQGAVKTEEQKQQMEKTVQDVSGVTSVDNQLKVSAALNDSTNP